MKRFYITGVSGVGKSTVAEKLRETGIHTVDLDKVEGLCRWIHKDTHEVGQRHPGMGKEFFESHEYTCDTQQLIALMNEAKDVVVVVGIADNQSDFLSLFDKVFFFYCDEEIFLKRIKERTNHDFGKRQVERETILIWYKYYEKEMLAKGAIPINTAQPLEVVVDRVLKEINS